jgi:D-inositol-3-phosphate glycosyltransferase
VLGTALHKRIAIVCFSRSLGGLELTVLRLARAMIARGISVTVIVPQNSELERRARDVDLHSITITPRWKYGDLGAAIRLARVLKKSRIDLVLLVQSQDIHLAALASLFSVPSKLVFYQQMQSRFNKRGFVHTWMYSKLLLWITLTQAMKKDVLECTRVPGEKVRVMPLGIDVHRFDPLEHKQAGARKYFDLPAKSCIVGVLGRLDKLKGQHVLLQAVPDILKRHPRTFFVIAGDETAGASGYKEYLRELCRTLNIERSVKFLPFTEDAPRLMAALDVFVLPSFSETYGLVVLEAMSMQKPVIATAAGGVPELVRHGKTGLLIKPNDVVAMTRALQRILGNARLRKSLGRRARADVLKKFDFDACVDAVLGLLAAI